MATPTTLTTEKPQEFDTFSSDNKRIVESKMQGNHAEYTKIYAYLKNIKFSLLTCFNTRKCVS